MRASRATPRPRRSRVSCGGGNGTVSRAAPTAAAHARETVRTARRVGCDPSGALGAVHREDSMRTRRAFGTAVGWVPAPAAVADDAAPQPAQDDKAQSDAKAEAERLAKASDEANPY